MALIGIQNIVYLRDGNGFEDIIRLIMYKFLLFFSALARNFEPLIKVTESNNMNQFMREDIQEQGKELKLPVPI
jgi:hypothetical protein